MGKLRNCSRAVVGGLAAWLVVAPEAEAADTNSAAVPPAPANHVVKVRAGVRVPPGILAGVPTGSIPGGARLWTYYPPYPVGFSADPYFSPPAVVTVPPPIVFAPPPFLYGAAPFGLPFYGGCFVPSDFAGQHGYYGSCAEALYRQWTSRPY